MRELTPLETVERFLARWAVSREQLWKSFEEMMHPDCVWENIGVATTTGPTEAIAFLEAAMAQLPFETIRVEWRGAAVDGHTVYAERIDILVDADGNDVARIAAMGVFVIRQGMIAAWREYFDTSGGG